MKPFESVVRSTGFLPDHQIKAALDEGWLLEEGSWDNRQLRHATYTLTLGARVSIARAVSQAQNREFVQVNLTTSEPVLTLNPSDTALLYSKEHFRLPACVLALTVARGLLFAEALCPENTYVDPGFTGPLYTTVTNVSNRVIHLEYGMPITRVFFYRLETDVENPYRPGEVLGIAQQLSSVRAIPSLTNEQCRTENNAHLLDSVARIPVGGNQIAEIFKRLLERQQSNYWQLAVLAVAWPILFITANNSKWVTDNLGAFLGNILAGIVTGLIFPAVAWIVDKIRTK